MKPTNSMSIHVIGRIACIVALILIVMIPLSICLKFDIFPPMKNFLGGFFQAVMIYLPISIAEFLTFVPILGSGAYLAFITGNLTNLKIPCAAVAMEGRADKVILFGGKIAYVRENASCLISRGKRPRLPVFHSGATESSSPTP
jgi:hypothetical protein